MVARSDLILTATKKIRFRVLEDSPGALRRTFTVLEFAALLDLVPPETALTPETAQTAQAAEDDEDADLAALVRTVAEQRSRGVDDYDIPDPYGRGAEAHLVAAQAMASAVESIATRFNQEVAGR